MRAFSLPLPLQRKELLKHVCHLSHHLTWHNLLDIFPFYVLSTFHLSTTTTEIDRYTPHHLQSNQSIKSIHTLLKVLPLNQIRDIIIALLLLRIPPFAAAILLLHALVALRQLPEAGEGVGAELVEDAGDELGEFFVFAGTVDGEGVGGNGGVDFIEKGEGGWS